MILVDAHVHIYDCYNPEIFFDSAFKNFATAANIFRHEKNHTCVLLLAESSGCNWFDRLKAISEAEPSPMKKGIGSWEFIRTREECSLIARTSTHRCLFLIAGRQIETSEKLEILALATHSHFTDGKPIKELIEDVRECGGIPVIPWGFGKWVGRRGAILKKMLDPAKDGNFFLGDNGGRPAFFSRSLHFEFARKKGIQTLPGSDPLPFASENNQAGSFGFSLPGHIFSEFPAEDLKKILYTSKSRIQPYGAAEGALRFFRNQSRMQIKKHFIKKTNPG